MTDLPDMRVKALVSFPANVVGGDGIAVTKDRGTYTFDLAHGEFPTISAVPTSPTNTILTYDTVTREYSNIKTDLLGGAVSGIADAPVDATFYGRNSANWVHPGVADVTGLQTALNAKAALASPVFTGNPTAPTPPVSDADTSIATTAFVAAAIAASSGSLAAPQGRLTLTSNTPVMTTSVAASNIIYYTPACGNQVPVYNGTNFVSTTFSQLIHLTTDATKSPTAVGPNVVYDLFVWNDAGTLQLSRGPGWLSITARPAGSALVSVNGILLNNVAITNGPAAQRGTYVGTIYSNAASTVDYILGGAASGGLRAYLGIWNAYNRVGVAAEVTDTVAPYNYSGGIRIAGGSSNEVVFVVGLAQEEIAFSYLPMMRLIANNAYVHCGIGLDSTAAYAVIQTVGHCTSTGATQPFFSPNSAGFLSPGSGVGHFTEGAHFIAALENGDSTNLNQFNCISANRLGVRLRM